MHDIFGGKVKLGPAAEKRIAKHMSKRNSSYPENGTDDDDNISISSILVHEYQVGSTVAALAAAAAVVVLGLVADVPRDSKLGKLFGAIGGIGSAATQQWELGESVQLDEVVHEPQVEFRSALPKHLLVADDLPKAKSTSSVGGKPVKRAGSFLDKLRGSTRVVDKAPKPSIPRDPFVYSFQMDHSKDGWAQGEQPSAEEQLRGVSQALGSKQTAGLRPSIIKRSALPDSNITDAYTLADRQDVQQHGGGSRRASVELAAALWGTDSELDSGAETKAIVRKRLLTVRQEAAAPVSTLPRQQAHPVTVVHQTTAAKITAVPSAMKVPVCSAFPLYKWPTVIYCFA